jgi:hypothetical protein
MYGILPLVYIYIYTEFHPYWLRDISGGKILPLLAPKITIGLPAVEVMRQKRTFPHSSRSADKYQSIRVQKSDQPKHNDDVYRKVAMQ